MKRLLSVVLVLCLVLGVLLAGLKILSMYRNVWNMLDELSYSGYDTASNVSQIMQDIETLKTQTDTLATQVDHLHRQTFYSANSAPTAYDYSWVNKQTPYIAHACGGIGEDTYTNSREAFIHNYALGQRIFEIDFNLSNDGVLIASHDEDTWRRLTGSDRPYTSDNFNQTAMLSGYHTLSCSQVIELMAAHPDVYVVTDTKATTQAEVMLAFSQLVYCAKQTHPEVLERIIPQIYNEEMLPWISSIYPFRSVIFTLYQLRWTPDDILNFCMNSGVRFITMPADQVSEDVLRLWDTLGIRVGVHTINDEHEAAKLFDLGADVLYTDYLIP